MEELNQEAVSVSCEVLAIWQASPHEIWHEAGDLA